MENHITILVFENWNSTSRTGIGGRKKKEVISNSKTTTLTYFDKLKKKQQNQGGKYFYVSFIELWPNDYSTISNLRKTTKSEIFWYKFCFENTKLLRRRHLNFCCTDPIDPNFCCTDPIDPNFCCTDPIDPNFWQIKIIILISQTNFSFFYDLYFF